jgi:uncharacterized phiE125 gp8 family phage protein
MALALITAPTTEPVTLVEARQHLRIDDNVQDDVLSRLISAARRRAEVHTRRALITQTWDLVLDFFPVCEIQIPRPPLQSVTTVKYIDTSGVQQTLDPLLYTVDTRTEPGRVTPAYGESWPSVRDQYNAVEVRFVAGFGAATAVPEDIKAAILLMVGHLYEHREEVSDAQTFLLPRAVDALLDHWQLYKF